MKKAPKVLMWNCVQERGIKNNSGVKLHLRRRPQRLTWASSPRGEAEVRVWTQRTSGIRHDEESVDDEWRNREADVSLLSWIWPTSGGGLCWSHWNTSWVNSPQMSHWGRSGKQWERRGERRGGKGGGRREGVKDGWRTGWWRGCGVLGKTQVGKYLILLNFLLFSCLSFSFLCLTTFPTPLSSSSTSAPLFLCSELQFLSFLCVLPSTRPSFHPLSFSYYHPYLTSIQDHQCRPLLDPQRNNGSLPLTCRSLPPGSFHTCSFLQWRRRTYSTSPWTLQPDKHMIRGQRSADQQCKKVECGPICQGFFLTLTPTKLN